MLDSLLVDTPMDYQVKLDADMSELFADVRQYRRLVWKLIYLTVTRSDITYVVGVVSQFMQTPRQPHWEALLYFAIFKGAPESDLLYKPSQNLMVEGCNVADWAGSRSDRNSTSDYCTFIGGNLMM